MKISLAMAALAVTLVIVGCGVAVDVEDRIESREDTFVVDDSSRLEVDTFNGSITVIAGPDGEIRIEAELRKPDGLQYEVKQDGDTVKVEARKKGIVLGTQPTANLHVTVPQSTLLDLETTNGNIQARGVKKSATLRTSNGKIILEEVSGDIKARTTNGNIEVVGLEGSARLNTSNGSVEFSGTLVRDTDNELTTSNGQISIVFEGDPSVQLDARTTNGTIRSEVPIVATKMEKTQLIGKYGDGEARLKVETTNGSITIR